MEQQVLLWEMTRAAFREGIESGRIQAAIVPTGSTEQHLEHLAMIHDTASVTYVAEKAALALYPRVVVATPLAIGISEHWMKHKGTLTVREELFCELVYDVCDSLKRGGIQHILVLNGHGGNVPVAKHMEDFAERLEIPLRFYSYWDLISRELIAEHMESGQVPSHAREFETSIALAVFPERVHHEAMEDREAKLATAEKGEAMIQGAVAGVVCLLQEMMGSDA